MRKWEGGQQARQLPYARCHQPGTPERCHLRLWLEPSHALPGPNLRVGRVVELLQHVGVGRISHYLLSFANGACRATGAAPGGCQARNKRVAQLQYVLQRHRLMLHKLVPAPPPPPQQQHGSSGGSRGTVVT